MNRNKVAEPDGTVTKMLSALDDFGIDKISVFSLGEDT